MKTYGGVDVTCRSYRFQAVPLEQREKSNTNKFSVAITDIFERKTYT
jgi:hypothetical protein